MCERRETLGSDFAENWSRQPVEAGDEQGGPRVLFEEPDGATAFAVWSLLEARGYKVSWCPGPGGPPKRACPLVTCGRCDLVEDADVVVSSLPLHRRSTRHVLNALRRLHADTPVVVTAPQHSLAQSTSLFGRGWRAIRMPVRQPTLVEAIDRALAASES